jgi:hypothetical protein
MDQNRLTTKTLEHPHMTLNADGSTNSHGSITQTVDLLMKIGNHREWITFAITRLHGHTIFLGHDWIYEHNPHVDWQKKTIMFDRCQHFSILCAGTTKAAEIAIAQEQKKEKKTW